MCTSSNDGDCVLTLSSVVLSNLKKSRVSFKCTTMTKGGLLSDEWQ